jgi:hypothetical protein
METDVLRWAEDESPVTASGWQEDSAPAGHFITKCSSCDDVLSQCRCPGPHEVRYAVCDSCSGRTALRNAPSKPYFTDEYEPTNATLWERCLEVVNGKRRYYTESGRTINSPNHGRGYRHMPNPKGIAWAVKQYNGFGGGWKARKEDVVAHTAELRVMAQGGVVVARPGELDALGRLGLARVASEAHGHVYWDVTAKGQRVALAGLVGELSSRMEKLLGNFDVTEAKKLAEWMEANFRINSPKTPSGGKALKETLKGLVWVLKHRYDFSTQPDPAPVVAELQRYWQQVSPKLGVLAKFTDEGGSVVPKELELGGVKYVNDAAASEASLQKYAKRLDAVFSTLKGWRKKSLSGNLVVVLKPAAAFRGTVGGKYKRDEDALWVRTTPAVLKRGQGYGSFEYIIVHELGHRYERFHKIPQEVEWGQLQYTTRYSYSDGEAFAELFALGHFGIKGNWDHARVERFEKLMTGKAED